MHFVAAIITILNIKIYWRVSLNLRPYWCVVARESALIKKKAYEIQGLFGLCYKPNNITYQSVQKFECCDGAARICPKCASSLASFALFTNDTVQLVFIV